VHEAAVSLPAAQRLEGLGDPRGIIKPVKPCMRVRLALSPQDDELMSQDTRTTG